MPTVTKQKPYPGMFLGPGSVFGNWWRDLAVYQWLPEKGGTPHSPLGTLRGSITPAFEGTPTWQNGVDGPELSFSGTVQSLDIKGGEIDYTQRAWTILLRFSTTDSDDNAVFFGHGNTSDNDPLMILQNSSPTGGSGLKMFVRDTGGDDGNAAVGNSDTGHRDGRKHTAIVTYAGGGGTDLRMWLDGIEQAVVGSGTGPTDATTFQTRRIAAVERSSIALRSDMQCSVLGEWHREMAVGEVLNLNRDVFAPVRTLFPLFAVKAPAAGGLSIPVAMQSYRQRRIPA